MGQIFGSRKNRDDKLIVQKGEGEENLIPDLLIHNIARQSQNIQSYKHKCKETFRDKLICRLSRKRY